MIADGKIGYLCIQFRNVVELTLINIETTHKGDHPLDSLRECFMTHDPQSRDAIASKNPISEFSISCGPF